MWKFQLSATLSMGIEVYFSIMSLKSIIHSAGEKTHLLFSLHMLWNISLWFQKRIQV